PRATMMACRHSTGCAIGADATPVRVQPARTRRAKLRRELVSPGPRPDRSRGEVEENGSRLESRLYCRDGGRRPLLASTSRNLFFAFYITRTGKEGNGLDEQALSSVRHLLGVYWLHSISLFSSWAATTSEYRSKMAPERDARSVVRNCRR